MKILACSLTYPLPNGVTSSINESINGFAEQGHEIRIISPDYGSGKARPEHHHLPTSKLAQQTLLLYFSREEQMFGLGSGLKIRQLVKDFQPDAFWLHTVTWASNIFERTMLKSPLPKILTYHSMLDLYGSIYARKFFGPLVEEQGRRQMIRRSAEVGNAVDQIIAPSHFVAQKLTTFGVTQPISVIPTGIEPIHTGYTKAELAQKYKFSTEAKLLLFVGRVVREKNIIALLTMLAELVKTEPKAVLLLVGPGEIAEMKAQAKALKISKNIVFTNQVPLAEARRYYTGADAFVFASQSETQGLVIGEAMSAGLPVVALTSPVQPEVYPEGTAVIVQTESQLSNAISELWKNPKKAKELAVAGQKFVTEKFSKKIMIDKQIAVFERIVGGK